MNKEKLIKILSITTVIAYFVGIFTLLSIVEYPWLCLIPFTLGVSGTVIITLLNRDKVLAFVTSKFGKRLLDNFIGFILIFFIISLVNYMAVKNPKVWDFSHAQYSSLTIQTKNILNDIDQKKEKFSIKIFASKTQKDAIEALVNLYRNESSNIDVEFFDAEVRSDLISKYELTVSPALIVEEIGTHDESKRIIVSDLRELSITNALLKISREVSTLICFRDTPNMIDQSEVGYSNFTTILRQGYFDIKLINLLKEKSIEDECKAFVVWGLQEDLTEEEIKKLDEYSKLMKPLIFAISPLINGDKIGKLRKFIASKGISLSNDIVMDPNQSFDGSNGSAPLITMFDEEDINSNLNSQVFLPIGSSVFQNELTEKEKYVFLGRTTKDSWAESDLLSVISGNATFDGKDFEGPIDIAGAVKNGENVKIVVFGNSTLVANKFFQFQSNFKFVLNIFYWASSEAGLASVQAAVLPEVPVFISATQFKVIFYFSIIFVPLLMFCTAIIKFNRARS